MEDISLHQFNTYLAVLNQAFGVKLTIRAMAGKVGGTFTYTKKNGEPCQRTLGEIHPNADKKGGPLFSTIIAIRHCLIRRYGLEYVVEQVDNVAHKINVEKWWGDVDDGST